MSARRVVSARRLWAIVGIVLIAAAVLVALTRPGSDRALDPSSPASGGGKALATALRGYGVRVHTSTDPSEVRGQIVVVEPQDYSARQLRALAARGELVMFGDGGSALIALGTPAHPLGTLGGRAAPGCDWPGAVAAGPVDLPDGTETYTAPGVQSCYGGTVLRGSGWTLLGSSALLRNDTVARTGVAALDVNAISADRAVHDVTWLLPGTSARGEQAAPTVWALFPDGARRAFVWLIVLGVLLVAWRARRLGRVVSEPLPVLVRAAEIVEGHGRLYHRAGARERAATALRAGAIGRLTTALHLPRSTPPSELVTAVALRTGRPPDEVGALLLGAPPPDDAALIELATALDDLQGSS
ncbi:MAG TPA: DUF4350 domain-containing protein [Jatrophihabitantaceae bacterium]|nr:DUF4350 domain-containing protein [Jatrophihabitantaceae bacterium]